MAIIFMEGFDYYNGQQTLIGMQSRWNMGATGGTSLTAGRFGGQAWWQNSGGAAFARYAYANLPSTYSSWSCGFAFKWVTAQTFGGSVDWMSWGNLGSATHIYMWQSGGQLYFYNGSGALLGTTAVCIVLGSWHYIEVSVLISDTVGTLLVKVDGVTQLNLTGLDTRNGATTTINYIQLGNGQTDNRLGSYLFDDIYMTDSTTSLGERKIETLRAAADSVVTWTPDSGVNNYSRVNETLVDGDTSYVETATVGNRDLYTLASLGSAATTVDAVQIVGFGRKTDAATRAVSLSVKSGAVDDFGSDNYLTSSYARYARILPTNPNGGGAWSYASVNALLIGPKVTV